MGAVVFISLMFCSVVLLSWIWKLFCKIWLKPIELQRQLNQQGIYGHPYKLLYGNLKEIVRSMRQAQSQPINLNHKIVSRVIPFLHQTVESYGKMSIHWVGTHPRVNIMDPELIREVLSNKFGHFAKPESNPLTKLLATGLVNYDGEKWAKHRRILNPAFHQEKLKRMVPAMFTSASELISRWEELVGSEGSREINVWPELQNFTADVISRTAFGSNYREGMQIFQLQTEQAELVNKATQAIYIPGLRFLPTKDNVRRNEINREVETLVRGMVEKRKKATKMGDAINDDLLGLLMESNSKESQENGNSKSMGMTMDDVVEECKLFYFAGQETTSVLLTWTMIVLSMHPNWQEKAREEVLQVFGKNKPDLDGLSHLKIVKGEFVAVTLILFEVLRLYPPGAFLIRRTYKEMKLGELTLPPGVQLSLPILLIHHDPEIWGEDVEEFKPDRFSEGVAKASNHQLAFFPFGWGPRICIGQNFALLEAKLALAMILQRFSFELSPSYAHAPYTVITIQPQHGAQIILHKL
ncbi:cytochrome P450 CYP72A219-like protein [Cinnamomum micranthum f. kanehirae]|uniref:Cytochrome P450 CYP72A219-like protein n=1 Tax=Cinnamomum micranthum f. kanehirae TaxID=337451 RepID=A0A3S3QSS9_9MAGN|nr:cytochrome P450 CYP72A219-like protein [Cinnamomum micranthum f. kanehirae]